MKLLALYWSFLIIGYIIAWRSAKKGKTFAGLAKAMMVTVYGLCLIMGLRMGANEQVIENLGTTGSDLPDAEDLRHGPERPFHCRSGCGRSKG